VVNSIGQCRRGRSDQTAVERRRGGKTARERATEKKGEGTNDDLGHGRCDGVEFSNAQGSDGLTRLSVWSPILSNQRCGGSSTVYFLVLSY
jgi:hypothetical protein